MSKPQLLGPTFMFKIDRVSLYVVTYILLLFILRVYVYFYMQAIDDDCNQTGQMTAAFLDWPQVNIIRKSVLINVFISKSVNGCNMIKIKIKIYGTLLLTSDRTR